MSSQERIAILPGSYDPFTRGHAALAKRAALLFDRIVVAVMQNREKKYLFTVEERVRIAEASVADIPNAKVISDDGLLVDLYQRIGACCVVKGIRNEYDYAYENKQAEWNRAHLDGFETLYLPAEEGLSAISSTEVRKRLEDNAELCDLLTPEAERLVSEMRKSGN